MRIERPTGVLKVGPMRGGDPTIRGPQFNALPDQLVTKHWR